MNLVLRRRLVLPALLLTAYLASHPCCYGAGMVVSFGDAGHSVSDPGDWASNAFTGLGLGQHYQSAPDNNATSTWEFTGLANGTYHVAANWTSEPNRTNIARYNMTDGGPGVTVDQTDSTRDFYELVSGKPIGWKNLGQVTIADGDLIVDLADSGDALLTGTFMMADSIRISTTPGVSSLPGLGQGVVIDDGSPGHTLLGEGPTNGANGGVAAWVNAVGGYNSVINGFNQDYLYDNEDSFVNHAGALASEWEFSGLTPGVPVNISLHWTASGNRGTNVPVTVSGIDGGDQTVLLNQELAPLGDAYELDDFGIAKPFQSIGRFTPTSSTVVVTMSNDADEFVIPDAVRIATVPEPASAMLAFLAAAGLVSRRNSSRLLR